VIGSWIGLLLTLGAVVGLVGTSFGDSTRLPSSDSATAYAMLAQAGSSAASGTPGVIVWHSDTGSAVSPSAAQAVVPVLNKIAKVDGVSAVISPFSMFGGEQVSADQHTAFARVMFADTAHASQAKKLVHEISSPDLVVQTGGRAFTNQRPSEVTEVIGVLAALVILLFVFRSLLAALLPIITAVVGVGTSAIAVMLLSHVLSLSDVSISLGALIGLGVGIDYALLVVNRHRKALRSGADVETAVVTAMSTAGRAVLFAGGTVIAALIGMFVLGVGFLSGMAIAAALTVALTVAAAVTLLPALLALIGRRVLRRRERTPRQDAVPEVSEGRVWGRWADVVARRPIVMATSALLVLVALAGPALSIRLGSADDSSDPKGTVTRTYYQTMSSSFGPGYDATLLLVAETPDASARQAWSGLVAELPHVTDVAAVSQAIPVKGSTVSMVAVTPATPAQARQTSDLVRTLRSDVIVKAERGTDLQVHVGGTTATSIDFANALAKKLPLFLGIIAVLGMVLLTVAFRSLLVPLVGALSNLLTIAVALGATVFLFQWGHGPSVLGIGAPAPVEYMVVMLIVGVMFGLSMDYHVFLVSRMREEWLDTSDNSRAVKTGVSDTGHVVATAAVIMACVFASFGLSGMRISAEFGVGLAVAVLADAFLIRMTLIPAIMHKIGALNWAIPGWLDRALPQVSLEGGDDIGATDGDVDTDGEPSLVAC
jgi:RND superfamily putative drug exporter